MLGNVHAIVIEDSVIVNKGFVRALKAQGVSNDRINGLFDYSSAHQTLETLDKNTSLFVLLDWKLSERTNESGVELYFFLRRKFPKARIINISSEPEAFEQAIREQIEGLEGKAIFDGVIRDKCISSISDHLEYYKQSITKTSSTLYQASSTDTSMEPEIGNLVVVSHRKHCRCLIS